MDRFTSFITEAKKFNAKAALAKIVKELKSSDFGMTEAGGNGIALSKGGNLVVRDGFFYFDQKHFDRFEDAWVNPKGHDAVYFGEKYGVKFKLVDKSMSRTKKLFKSDTTPGVMELVLSVHELGAE